MCLSITSAKQLIQNVPFLKFSPLHICEGAEAKKPFYDEVSKFKICVSSSKHKSSISCLFSVVPKEYDSIKSW